MPKIRGYLQKGYMGLYRDIIRIYRVEGFAKLVVFFRCPYEKDFRVLGWILRYPNLGNLPY